MSGFVDKFPHVLRQDAFEAQPVVGNRVNEAKHRCVEGLATKSQRFQDRPQPWMGAPI